jgi:hypothetical protein
MTDNELADYLRAQSLDCRQRAAQGGNREVLLARAEKFDLAADRLASRPLGDGEALARRFHEIYERLAPSFGYETRAETREFDPATPNGKLMIAVCQEVATTIPAELAETVERLRGLLDTQAWAADWKHNIVPPGKPAQELACAAIRALPALLDHLTRGGEDNG